MTNYGMGWLNYHHLLYFWVVARTGSISKASRELLVSQPTISTQLKALETSLGEKLFDRVGRGLQLLPGIDRHRVVARGSQGDGPATQ